MVDNGIKDLENFSLPLGSFISIFANFPQLLLNDFFLNQWDKKDFVLAQEQSNCLPSQEG